MNNKNTDYIPKKTNINDNTSEAVTYVPIKNDVIGDIISKQLTEMVEDDKTEVLEIRNTDIERTQRLNFVSPSNNNVSYVKTMPVVNRIPNQIGSQTINNNNIEEVIDNKIKEQIKNDNKKDYIVFDHVCKDYKNETVLTQALNDVSFSIDEGELVIFLGHSGAGKTTALNMLGGMDAVTSGRVVVGNKEISNYNFDELTEYRRSDIGFVFQFYNLIPNLTAQENIELSTELCSDPIDAEIVLRQVGLETAINKFPQQLSGGEQQRVSIARAVAKNPKILLCDEPTGALDYANGKQILKLLQDTCKENKITTIIITHNQVITPMADKIIHFKSGKVIKVEENPTPINIEEIEW